MILTLVILTTLGVVAGLLIYRNNRAKADKAVDKVVSFKDIIRDALSKKGK